MAGDDGNDPAPAEHPTALGVEWTDAAPPSGDADAIRFDAHCKIERGMPALLSRAGMSATAWRDFCDGVDDDLMPLLQAEGRKKATGNALIFMCLLNVILLATTLWRSRKLMMIGPPLFFVMVLFALCHGSLSGTGVAEEGDACVSKRCDEASNGLRDVVMTLNADVESICPPKTWHIEVEVQRGAREVESAATACVTATAVEPEIVVHAVAEPTAPPKE